MSTDDHLGPDADLLNAAVDLLLEGRGEPEAALLERFPELTREVPEALERARRYVERVRPRRVLGDFELVALLGEGNMGRVFRARQRSLGGREVALKLLPPELAAQDPRFAERFRREADSAAQVHHPNVAEVYGSGEHQGQFYFAMRLVEGRTLADILAGIAERRLRGQDRTGTADYARRVAQVVRQLADALAALHEKGLVHRDVKPSNVVMEGARLDDERGLEARPILVDFGLARPAEGSDSTGTRGLGTPAYSAPEALLGEPVDARADVFGLGVLMHDLLAVTRPGERTQAAAGLEDVRGLNRGVDARLGAIVRMATDKRPAVRYADGAAFRDELDRYLRGESLRALPASPLARARLWMRREPARALRIVAAVVVLTPVLVGLGWLGGEAWGTYELAGEASAHVGSGDLHAARGEYRELLGAPLVELLPGLQDDRERAVEFEERYGALVDQLTVANASELRSGQTELQHELRSAHTELQQRLLTPGKESDEWRAHFLAFLGRQVAGDVSDERRRAAAETLMAWFVVHPLPVEWARGEELEVADLLQQGPVPRDVLDDVHAQLTSIARDVDADVELRANAVGALANMPCDRSLEVLTEVLADEDPELRGLAVAAASQVVWMDWRQGPEVLLSIPALARWVHGLYGNYRGSDSSSESRYSGSAARALMAAALADLFSDGALRSQLEPMLDERPSKHFAAVLGICRAHTDPASSMPESFPEPFFRDRQFEWDNMTRASFWDSTFGARQDDWLYFNIWDQSQSRSSEGRATLRAPAPAPLHAALGFANGAPTLYGAAVEQSWQGGTLSSDVYQHFLVLDSIGGDGLRFSFRPPESLPKGFLQVEIAHARGSRWYLPDGGSSWLQVRSQDGEVLLEGPGPEDPCVWTFTLWRPERKGEDLIELQVKLAAGNTTHRVLWIAVRESSATTPENDPSRLASTSSAADAGSSATVTSGSDGKEGR